MSGKAEKDEAPREREAHEDHGQELTARYIVTFASALERIDDGHKWSSGPRW